MNTPAFLPGMTLLFWGWQSGHWIAGGVCALAVESHHLTTTRWSLSLKDCRRAALLTFALVAALFAVFTVSRGLPYAVIPAIAWLPAACLPLLLAQIHSGRQSTEIEALLIFKPLDKADPGSARRINLHWPYLGLCLLAASTGNVRDISFYAGLLCLSAWALWSVRRATAPAWLWLTMLGLAGIGGYAGANGLARLQVWLVDYSGDFFGGGNVDPYRSATDIGEIGELKQTNKIMLRITGPEPHQGSFLLHRASYDSYGSPTWFARRAALKPLAGESPEGPWQLQGAGAGLAPGKLLHMRINDEFPRGAGVLSLPAGTAVITSTDFDSLRQNRLGVLKATGRAGEIAYTVDYLPGRIQESAPTDLDLKLPRQDAGALRDLASQLQLNSHDTRTALKTVKQFFDARFKYALFQPERKFVSSPLIDFLFHNRFGHCEYFATATVMLLRAAGIPARYAIGYSVQEYSALEQAWRVRQRHAHAWARVWTGARWVDLDTTPVDWLAAENAQAPGWEPLLDLLSWLRFQFGQWRQRLATGELSPLWLLLAVPALLWAVWRLRKRGARERLSAAAPADMQAPLPWPGRDSGFYRIERRLAEKGWVRHPDETPRDWHQRILNQHPELGALPALDAIIDAHYDYRFNPGGQTAASGAQLTEAAAHWLRLYEQKFRDAGKAA